MQITVELPDDIAQRPNPGREALEALAIAGYRSSVFTASQTRLILGFETRYELNGFLKAHEVWDHAYSVEDLEKDAARFEAVEAMHGSRRPQILVCEGIAMMQIELSPDIENRLQAQARAQGVEAESFVRNLIETALRSAPIRPRRSGVARDMNAFFKAMAANSDKIPQLPDEAFTRESFYQDHD